MSGFEDNFDPFATSTKPATGCTLVAQHGVRSRFEDDSAQPIDMDNNHFGSSSQFSHSSNLKGSVIMPSSSQDHFGGEVIRRESFSSPVSPSHSVNAKYLEIQGLENRTKIIIDHILQQREQEFVTFEKFSLFVGTYNVNGQPPLVSMAPWLTGSTSVAPDIYAVGFQELDNSQQAFIFGTTPRESEWSKAVELGLHPGAMYFEVRRIRLIGMFLLIYAKENLRSKISEVGFASVGTGLMNRMGNKGGVAVSIKICDGTICFVCSHFAAHFDELDRRNMDFHQVSKLNCECEMPHVRRTVYDHDIVVWLGDLNYRLQQPDGRSADYDTVKKLCFKEDFMSVLGWDQLKLVQVSSLAFVGWSEGHITFPPSYKYDPGTDNFDTSEKHRVPAWCDRVLWYAEAAEIKLVSYFSVPTIRLSDHKPVYAEFEIKMRKIDANKFENIQKHAIKEADRLENEYLPQVKLNKTEFSFGDVKYFEVVTEVLEIENTGQLPVEYLFRTKPDNSPPCQRWVVIEPATARIPPGETFSVSLQVLVERESAWSLMSSIPPGKKNAKSIPLEDILILSLVGGKDYFVILTGNYIVSGFGQSLEALASLEDDDDSPSDHSLDNVPTGLLIDVADSPSSSAQSLLIPNQMIRLITHVRTHGLCEPDLFSQDGKPSEFGPIRDSLDQNLPDPLPGTIYSVCSVLLQFLESLLIPVVPWPVSHQCVTATTVPSVVAAIKTLPRRNYRVFEYILRFLTDVSKWKDKNGASPERLASVFGPILLQSPPGNPSKSVATLHKDKCIRFLIVLIRENVTL